MSDFTVLEARMIIKLQFYNQDIPTDGLQNANVVVS